jgi:hypothetical protein
MISAIYDDALAFCKVSRGKTVTAIFAVLLAAVLPPLFCQEAGQKTGSSGAASFGRVDLIPRLVYVGDPARLVVELGSAVFPGELIEDPLLLPAARDLVISRVELETRQGRSRLLVDFTAYAPGRLEFPPIRVGPLVFSALEAEIASILDGEAAGSGRVLSPPAPPLTAPGTMFFIYGSFAALILLAGGIAAARRSAPLIRRRLELRRRRRRFRALEKLFHRLAENLEEGRGSLEILEQLNREFRTFLAFISGKNCMTMVPAEFESLPDGAIPVAPPGESTVDAEGSTGFGGPWLRDFFRRTDTLRFRGGEAEAGETAEVLQAARGYLDEREIYLTGNFFYSD